MPTMKLFPQDHVVGIFRGFSEGGLEFHADLVLPYREEFQRTPMHGQFVLVQLESDAEAVLGRITAISAQGQLASGAGEDYGLRAIAEDRQIPEGLREQYLKYRIEIRVLGVVRIVHGKLVFAPSHRRLPHVGAKVAFLSDEVIQEVSGHNQEGAELGMLAYGEFVYAGRDERVRPEEWMLVRDPAVVTRFPVSSLVSRRSFVFARAGFGKSNLVKLLFSDLYAETPTVTKRNDRKVPVGTVLFDPDGEYFWPDDKNRPGLCDVPGLEKHLVVFTNRAGPSRFYQSFVAGGLKLDIRRLSPADVVTIAIPPERQDQQNVVKLRSLHRSEWAPLVDAIYKEQNSLDLNVVKQALKLDSSSEMEAIAARSNLTRIVSMLHDPGSRTLDQLLSALRAGKLCVIDVSQMRGAAALVLSGIVLQYIFDHNQGQFTNADPETIPTIAVVEEAQSVLGGRGSSGDGPYVTWVKEGRKYDLGAVLVTQQPGSIPSELLSQGDNWFIFHLLSAGDLQALKRANAHFSDDLLSSLLNEPIPGHCVFWSSAMGRSYPLPLRILSFESLYQVLDPSYDRLPAETFARHLHDQFESEVASRRQEQDGAGSDFREARGGGREAPDDEEVERDVFEVFVANAIGQIKRDHQKIQEIRNRGIPWKGFIKLVEAQLPDTITDREAEAHNLVSRVLDAIFGEGWWDTERRPSRSLPGSDTTWIVILGEARK